MTPPFLHWQGIVYRGHNPRWSYAPESGEGAKRHGGRFNRRGMSCLYTSLTPETAWLEAQQGLPFKAQPLTLCGYKVNCENVLDLSDPATRQALNIELTDMACGWEDLASRSRTPPSWTLADRLIALGTSAIITPSFASHATTQDRNMVFWHWSQQPPCQVKVIDDTARLPRDDRSWRESEQI